jgi:hypothetical protein
MEKVKYPSLIKHPVSYLMAVRGNFLEVKPAGSKSDHSSPPRQALIENLKLRIHSPTRLHGVLLN